METTVIVGIIFIVLSYFFGNLSPGDLISRFWAGKEIHDAGSKATGATNVSRVTGERKYAVFTFLVDMGLKGALWTLGLHYVFAIFLGSYWIVVTGLGAVILGHIYPVLSKFKTRGKGIATLIGGLLILDMPITFLIAIIGWIVTFNFSGIKSLSNLVFVSTLLLLGALFNFSLEFFYFALFSLCLVGWAHRENLRRIWRKEEEKSNWEDIWALTVAIGEMFRKKK